MRTQQYSRNTDALGRYYTSTAVSSLLIDQLPSTKPRAVLDLGSGRGALSLAASGRWSRSGLITVDVDALEQQQPVRRQPQEGRLVRGERHIAERITVGNSVWGGYAQSARSLKDAMKTLGYKSS